MEQETAKGNQTSTGTSWGGLAIVLNANKYKKRGAKYSKYFLVLRNAEDGRIENIASALGCPYNEAYTDLQEMIDMGILSDSYIDKNKGMLVGPIVNGNKKAYDVKVDAVKKEASPVPDKVIKCPNCGGMNKVNSNGGYCEYCGSPLK